MAEYFLCGACRVILVLTNYKNEEINTEGFF